MYLLKLAIRNIKRNKRRSLLAIISISIAVLFIVYLKGLIGGFTDSIVKNYTKNETGHIRISTKKFAENSRFYPITDNIENPEKIIEQILSNNEIADNIDLITQRINFGVLINHNGNNEMAVALAGNPELEKNLLMLQKSILPDGKYIENADETIIGYKLAQALNYKLGDQIRVMTSGSDYALHLKKFKIVGIFQSGLNTLDETIFQITLEDAKKLLRMGDQTQQIIIFLKDYRKSDEMALKIRNMLTNENLTILSWTKIGGYYAYVKLAEGIYNWIYFIVALFGAFIIGNIMMMVVFERRKEIGLIRSLGMSAKNVLFLFINEGFILGLIGSLIGSGLGFLLVLFFHYHGIDFSRMMGSLRFPMDNIINFKLSFYGIFMPLALGTVIAALISVAPSYKAAKMKIADSLKSV
ncbi:MAG: FtsX-like permease family protein [Candidatus Cloacimonadota bacterium]|nr:FtsX-like permease family protein [Candidatus Cloacimonadota bacterium]